MRVFTLRQQQLLPGRPDEVFAFFADARNLEAITPPLLRFEVVTPGEIPMRVGTLIQYRLTVRGIGLDWLTSIQDWDPPHRFVDVQVRGPYALWHHTHTFEPTPDRSGTLMSDTVRYAIGFGPLGALAARAFVHRDVARIFAFRREAVVGRLAAARPSMTDGESSLDANDDSTSLPPIPDPAPQHDRAGAGRHRPWTGRRATEGRRRPRGRRRSG
jgi:ligand-binding SRPBCC domain-containing protein